MKFFSRIFYPLYIVAVVGMFLYSYTQVDLSLTLSKISIWQYIEKAFQYIGYFQRPLSTELYILFIFLLAVCFVSVLLLVNSRQIERRTVWILIIFTAVILTFSYNAFSYDLFNYIFDAKIVTHYFQNPYLHKALDFPQDPMLSFMHWTQRTYPYGPVWLLLTVPLSFIGLQYFLPTLFLFKALAGVSYLVTCWSIEKILEKTDKEKALFGLSLFAFSPLVLIEGLVSAHNDIVMVAFASLALLTFVNRQSVRSFLLLVLSIGIKFATVVLLPLWTIGLFIKKKGQLTQLALVSFILLSFAVVAASVRTNFQPWYILFLYPFAALMPRNTPFIVGFGLFSFSTLLQYVPFLYTGNWNAPIPMILLIMLYSGLVLGVCSGIATWFWHIAKRK